MNHSETHVTLANIPTLQAKNYTDKSIFIFKERTLSYSDFETHTNQVANGLLKEQYSTETRIAFLGKDSDSSYEILFGSAKAKTVLLAINWRLSPQEILYIINDAEAELLFVDAAFIPVIDQIKSESIAIKKIIVIDAQHDTYENYHIWKTEQAIIPPNLSYSEDDIVLQLYTSGTTGKPKGVQLAHRSFFKLLQNMKANDDYWMNITHNDTLLLCVPFFHIGGLWWGVQGIIAGATHIVQDSFMAWQALEYIEKYRITKIAMVPAMLQFMLAEPNCSTTNFSSVEGFLYGGSPITPSLMKQAMKILNCDFYQIYGMTETGNMAVCLRPEDHTLEWNTTMKAAGKALPGVNLKVTDQNNNLVNTGTIGEIWIQSPSNMVGYWKNDIATQNTLQEGWIRTGDAGYIDDKGYVYICDRIKDMIICAGENIYPAEVEAVLSAHEAIQDITIIGIPDERWGEIAKAFIVLNPNYTLKKRELTTYAKGKIADYKIPQSVEFVDALPRNSSGKVLKRVLREPYWEHQDRLVN